MLIFVETYTVVPKIMRGLWHRVWPVGHHVDDKGTKCGLWVVMLMTKPPRVACGHHIDDKGTKCGLWAIMWMTKAPSVACGPSRR